MNTLIRFSWVSGLGACTALAYLAANGYQGWDAFQPSLLFEEGARLFTFGAVALLGLLPVVAPDRQPRRQVAE